MRPELPPAQEIFVPYSMLHCGPHCHLTLLDTPAAIETRNLSLVRTADPSSWWLSISWESIWSIQHVGILAGQVRNHSSNTNCWMSSLLCWLTCSYKVHTVLLFHVFTLFSEVTHPGRFKTWWSQCHAFFRPCPSAALRVWWRMAPWWTPTSGQPGPQEMVWKIPGRSSFFAQQNERLSPLSCNCSTSLSLHLQCLSRALMILVTCRWMVRREYATNVYFGFTFAWKLYTQCSRSIPSCI